METKTKKEISDLLADMKYKHYNTRETLDSIYKLMKSDKNVPDYLNDLLADLELNIGELKDETKPKLYAVIHKLSGTYLNKKTPDGIYMKKMLNEFPDMESWLDEAYKIYHIYDIEYITGGACFCGLMTGITTYTLDLFERSKKDKDLTEKLKELFKWVEKAMSVSDDMDTAVWTCFIEDLPKGLKSKEDFDTICDLMIGKTKKFFVESIAPGVIYKDGKLVQYLMKINGEFV